MPYSSTTEPIATPGIVGGLAVLVLTPAADKQATLDRVFAAAVARQAQASDGDQLPR